MSNRIFNQNKPGKYFWQTANIVDDLGLSVYAFRLYCHLVRVSSMKNVDISTRALAEACKVSVHAVSDAKHELVKLKLISLKERTGQRGRPYHEITILDITQRNVEHCERSQSSLQELYSSHEELISTPQELISYRGATPYKNIQERQGSAPTISKPEPSSQAPAVATYIMLTGLNPSRHQKLAICEVVITAEDNALWEQIIKDFMVGHPDERDLKHVDWMLNNYTRAKLQPAPNGAPRRPFQPSDQTQHTSGGWTGPDGVFHAA